jgi:hypothetical protein
MDALVITKDIVNKFKLQRGELVAKLAPLEKDIRQLTALLEKKENAFFQESVLAGWKKELADIALKIVEVTAYENTAEVFIQENKKLLTGTMVSPVVIFEQSAFDYDAESRAFWSGIDSVIEEKLWESI